MNYKDATTLGKIMKRVIELRSRYYIDSEGVVRTSWQGGWYPWHEVAKFDKRLII